MALEMTAVLLAAALYCHARRRVPDPSSELM